MADIDYDSLSRQDLMKLRSEVDRAIANVGDREKRAAIKAAEAAAREHGFSLSDLVTSAPGRGRSAARGGGNPPRFRNPDNPEQTWSGRGRRPRWYNEAEAAGRPIEDLRGS
jgi:DNA-binding protein H-NS